MQSFILISFVKCTLFFLEHMIVSVHTDRSNKASLTLKHLTCLAVQTVVLLNLAARANAKEPLCDFLLISSVPKPTELVPECVRYHPGT